MVGRRFAPLFLIARAPLECRNAPDVGDVRLRTIRIPTAVGSSDPWIERTHVGSATSRPFPAAPGAPAPLNPKGEQLQKSPKDHGGRRTPALGAELALGKGQIEHGGRNDEQK